MKATNRRDFLKKAVLAGASAMIAPSLLAEDGRVLPKVSSTPLKPKQANSLYQRRTD